MEQARASTEEEITNLSMLDAEVMEFSIISPTKLIARVEEQAWLARKGIKEIASLIVKGCL